MGQGHSGTQKVPSDLGMTVCSSPVTLGFSQAGWAGPTSQRLYLSSLRIGWLQVWWLKPAFHVGGGPHEPKLPYISLFLGCGIRCLISWSSDGAEEEEEKMQAEVV